MGASPCLLLSRWQKVIANTGDDLGDMYSTRVPLGSDDSATVSTDVWSCSSHHTPSPEWLDPPPAREHNGMALSLIINPFCGTIIHKMTAALT